MKDVIGFLLRFLIPVIGLGLVFLPLWYVGWKMAKKSWWHYIATIPVMAGIFLLINFLLDKLDRWVYNNIYDSHAVLDGILGGITFLVVVSMSILSISPIIFAKKLYLKLNIKNLAGPLLSSIALLIIQFIIFVYYALYQIGQAGQKYF